MRTGSLLKGRAHLVILALLAFVCGVLAIGWAAEHRRAECWRDQAEEGLAPEGVCT